MRKVITFLLFFNISIFAQWKPINTGVNKGLYGIQFFDTTNGIAIGADGLILKTSNSGVTWNADLDFINSYPDFYSLSLFGNSGGYITGRYGVILQTTNTGKTWLAKPGIGGYYLTHSFFISEDIGWVCGVYNGFFRTKFGSGYWSAEYLTKEQNQFNYLFTKDCITGYFVGSNGIAHKTIDGGHTSTKLNTNVNSKLENVTFINDTVGFIVGTEGTILKTTNAGLEWSKFQISSDYHFMWVTFVNDSVGWIVGVGGVILQTTNAGSSWNSVASGTTSNLRSIYFNGDNFGYIVGDSGTMLKYDPNFLVNIGAEENTNNPYIFKIHQNYPNPFNPTTTITFSIPNNDRVELKLFDILGKEVELIVDKHFNAGTHTIVFDGKGLASGMYIYRLRSGQNIATQKMVLAK